MRVLVKVRCACDEGTLMAEVGTDDDTPAGKLTVRVLGRWPDVSGDWSEQIPWAIEEDRQHVEDPRRHTRPFADAVPVICHRHPRGRPFFYATQLRTLLAQAEHQGKPAKLPVPPDVR